MDLGNGEVPARPHILDDDEIAQAIAEHYPHWRVWGRDGGWWARRKGPFRRLDEPGGAQYCVHTADAATLWVLLDLQDQLPVPSGLGWPGGCHEAPARPSPVPQIQGDGRAGTRR